MGSKGEGLRFCVLQGLRFVCVFFWFEVVKGERGRCGGWVRKGLIFDLVDRDLSLIIIIIKCMLLLLLLCIDSFHFEKVPFSITYFLLFLVIICMINYFNNVCCCCFYFSILCFVVLKTISSYSLKRFPFFVVCFVFLYIILMF